MTDLQALLGALVDALIDGAGVKGGPRERACLARGLQAALLRPGLPPDELVDVLVACLDADVSRQLDAIRQHPTFRALESAWRGVWLVVSCVEQGQNVRCELLNCSREDLLADFEDAPEIRKSGLYKIVYTSEFGSFGGKPFAAILADYTFGAELGDVALLRLCSEAASHACCPFLAAAHRSLVGPELSGPVQAAWSAFREAGCARFAGLVWAGDRRNGVFALGVCLVRSFSLWRHAANITGPVGGLVEEVPGGSVEAPREAELAEAGFIPLGVDVGTGGAIFRFAPTCLAPGSSAADPALPEPDRELQRQLPALLVISRFVQTLKVLHREQIGAWRDRDALERGLSAFLDGFVYRAGSVEASILGPYRLRTRRPLRSFELRVDEALPGEHRRRFALRLQPNWSCDGRFFTLAIEGTLDLE